jgi:hypothetical protein
LTVFFLHFRSNRFVKTTSPLFLKRIVAAYAIVTHDTAILEATDKFLLDANVKYDPEIARLATLHHLQKVCFFLLSPSFSIANLP